MQFPRDFLWGVASSAYQVEGAATADGRGPSVWDTFCKTPGAVRDGHTGEAACDHYHRFREDVKLIADMGVKAYRFSVSWSRVFPGGDGAINDKGLSFYSRLVDTLLDAGIQPWLTLFHWDYPQALQDRGGWLNASSPQWFAAYSAAVARALGDRVGHWMTINEPQIFIGHGHRDGTHAPGLKLSTADRLKASCNVLLAHGLSAAAIREHAPRPVQVGWAVCGRADYPATNSPQDIEAARLAFNSVTADDAWSNTFWADPACLGRFPADALALFKGSMPVLTDADLRTMSPPLDFYGVNIYSGSRWKMGPEGKPQLVPQRPGHPQTAFGWPVTPECMEWAIRFLHERYKLPVYITENGLACTDWVDLNGRVIDAQRIDFTRRYLASVGKAAADGLCKGYFHWSILDNFEWAEGYRMRFGLVHVDFDTLVRTPKASAAWYSKVARSGSIDHSLTL
ncbi:MAG: beta-glucosidase [Phycisphaerae bacterium]